VSMGDCRKHFCGSELKRVNDCRVVVYPVNVLSMKFRLGPLPEAPEFVPDANWTIVHEPTLPGFQLKAIPIAVVTTLVLAALWLMLTPVWQMFGTMTFPLPISTFIACLLGVIVVHELIHASVHPHLGLSGKTIIGFWPSRMFLYTIYVGELTRNRCLVVLIMPFIVISILPLVVAAATQTGSFWVGYISILNALLACGDLLAAYMTIRLFPAGASIRTKEWLTYWRLQN
jgi:hypothetical protein